METLTAATQPGTTIEVEESFDGWHTTKLRGWVLHLTSFNRTTKKAHTFRVKIEKSKIGALREFLTNEFYQGYVLDGIYPLETYR